MITHWLALIGFLGPWVPAFAVIFGVFSLTRLVTTDTIVDPLRNWFFDRFPHDGYTTDKRPKRGTWQVISQGKYYVTEGTKLGELISCNWCSGFWVALLITIALMVSASWTTLLLFPLALRVMPGIFASLID